MNQYLSISPQVQQALQQGQPVVALESTIISHGMPYPQNVQTAMRVEQTIRDNGAVPATIAIIGGRLKAGCTAEEIEYLGRQGQAVTKASRRDLPVLVARGLDGATTVTTTMIIAAMAGIKVFATGGIGGVHRGAETTMDISADLEELAQTPVMVICAGAKSILDLGLTLEYLETKGVPVIGYGTDELPAFYTRTSGHKVDYRIDTPEELAQAFIAKMAMGLKGGMLVAAMIGLESRATMDIDGTIKGINVNVEDVEKMIATIVSVPMDDGVEFQVKRISEIMDEAEYPGIRVSMETRFDGVRTPLKIDISTGDAITPREVRYRFKLMLEERSIDIWAYNLETILAEKLETVVSRSTTNTRMRDFYDLHMLSQLYGQTIVPADLSAALTATARKRNTEKYLADAVAALDEIEADMNMVKLWAAYQKKFSYASDVTWNSIMTSVRSLFKLVQSVKQ